MRLKVAAVFGMAFFALAGGTARANTTPSGDVQNTATVTNQVTVVFEFDLFDCPAGLDIGVFDWTANEPSRPDSGAVSGTQFYGVSNGDHDQRLVLQAGASSFLPGDQWVGSGDLICGTALIPVSGSGQTKSVNGGI